MPSLQSHIQWRLENPERVAEYSRRCRAKESSKQKQKDWKAANKEKVLATAKRWRERNKAQHSAAMKAWRVKNKAYINQKERERCASDPSHKLARRLRNRLYCAVKDQGGAKAASAIKLIGCDIRFLMGYLEARFKPGMKWSNHGEVWEIDHRVPCASFDLTDESHQRSCFHYSNLQPLFIHENRTKKDALPAPHQAELL